MSIFNKVRENLSDSELLLKLGIVVIMSICHWAEFFRSGFSIPDGIRAIDTALFVIVAIVTGKRFLWQMVAFHAMAILYYNRYINYTSFFLIIYAIILNPKIESRLLFIYIMEVLVCLIIYKDTFHHAVTHYGNCLLIYLGARGINRKIMDLKDKQRKDLILTPDEAVILRRMAEGKEIKQIEEFCSNTIYKKLRAAQKRNGVNSNSELKTLYQQQHNE